MSYKLKRMGVKGIFHPKDFRISGKNLPAYPEIRKNERGKINLYVMFPFF